MVNEIAYLGKFRNIYRVELIVLTVPDLCMSNKSNRTKHYDFEYYNDLCWQIPNSEVPKVGSKSSISVYWVDSGIVAAR